MPRLPTIALGVGLGATAGVVAGFDPATTWWMPSCPFFALTGLLCPLCGSLRAVHAFLTGAPIAAIGFNPLLFAATGAWAVSRRQTMAFCFSARGLFTLATFGLLRNLGLPALFLGR